MIFEDLQQAIVARLLWDAWFTQPKHEVGVIAEDPLDLQTQYETAIAKLGSLIVVARPTITSTERNDLVNVALSFLISENVTMNRSKSGSGKAAGDVGVKSLALLRNWTPNEDEWAPFLLVNLQPLGMDDDGHDHWILEMLTQTVLERLVTLLGTETGAALGDESGTGLLVSPTDA